MSVLASNLIVLLLGFLGQSLCHIQLCITLKRDQSSNVTQLDLNTTCPDVSADKLSIMCHELEQTATNKLAVCLDEFCNVQVLSNFQNGQLPRNDQKFKGKLRCQHKPSM